MHCESMILPLSLGRHRDSVDSRSPWLRVFPSQPLRAGALVGIGVGGGLKMRPEDGRLMYDDVVVRMRRKALGGWI